MNKNYWIIGGLITLGGAAAFGGYKLLKAVANISIRANGTHSFKFLGDITNKRLSFKQDFTIYNPSNTPINVALRQLKILKSGSEIGFTVPTSTNYTIPARGQLEVADIEIILMGRYLLEYSLDIANWLFADAKKQVEIQNAIMSQLSFKILADVDGKSIEHTVSPNNNSVKGLGVIAAFNRKLRPGKQYDKLFPKTTKEDPIVLQSGDVEDTVRIMLNMVKKYSSDTEKFAQLIKGENTKDTANRLWKFMYHHIQYKPDTEGVEQLRRPARVWEDRTTGVDCDCYSNFIASVLYNLDIPFKFRVTKYNFRTYYQHVYVVIPHQGKEIIMDVVLDHFNLEKPYTDKKDFVFKA